MKVLLLGLVLRGLLSVCASDSVLPYIYPDGYNASLYGSEVELRCLLHNDTYNYFWLINGMNSLFIKPADLTERGIRYFHAISEVEDETYTTIFIEPKVVNNNTLLQCKANINSDPGIQESNEIIFRVQGLLDPPTDLETKYYNHTHDILRWTNPFTLDLTGSDNDITGYSVTVFMEDPPPFVPYDLSPRPPPHTSNRTWSLGPSQEFTFLRYAFPVWLSVRAENPVGLGASSDLHQYSASISESCMRLKDLVSGDTAERKGCVAFSDSITVPSVEIVLSQLNSMYNVCLDTVEVRLALGNPDISSSSGSAEGEGREEEGETEVVVPSLRDRNITLLLRPHLLLPHTHYTATLSLDNQHSLSTSFSTYAVQNVSLTAEANTLVVQCMFAEGVSSSTTCTVVVEGGGRQWNKTFSDTHIFTELPTGTYSVRVYDSVELMGQVPAVEGEVEVTGESSTPDSTAVTPTTGDKAPTVAGPDGVDGEPDVEGEGPRDTAPITGHTLAVVIGVSLGCVLALILVVCLVLWLRVRHRCRSTSSYSVQKVEKEQSNDHNARPPSAVNPISLEQNELENSYARINDGVVEGEIKENPYEVVDPEEAREIERRKRERKEREATRAAAVASREQVFSEEELREIRRHTYSTVDMNKKREKKRRESTPPPLPPQDFNYHEDFPGAGGSVGLSPKEPNNSHVYDSLNGAVHSPVVSPTQTHTTQGARPSVSGSGGEKKAVGLAQPSVSGSGGEGKAVGPVYESISGLTVPSSSSPFSPVEEKDASRLSPPPLPPKSPQSPVDARLQEPSSHSGSRRSMIEAGATSPAPAVQTGLQRPRSMHITQFPSSPHTTDSSSSSGSRQLNNGGLDRGKMASLPLLLASSDLQHDV